MFAMRILKKHLIVSYERVLPNQIYMFITEPLLDIISILATLKEGTTRYSCCQSKVKARFATARIKNFNALRIEQIMTGDVTLQGALNC